MSTINFKTNETIIKEAIEHGVLSDLLIMDVMDLKTIKSDLKTALNNADITTDEQREELRENISIINAILYRKLMLTKQYLGITPIDATKVTFKPKNDQKQANSKQPIDHKKEALKVLSPSTVESEKEGKVVDMKGNPIEEVNEPTAQEQQPEAGPQLPKQPATYEWLPIINTEEAAAHAELIEKVMACDSVNGIEVILRDNKTEDNAEILRRIYLDVITSKEVKGVSEKARKATKGLNDRFENLVVKEAVKPKTAKKKEIARMTIDQIDAEVTSFAKHHRDAEAYEFADRQLRKICAATSNGDVINAWPENAVKSFVDMIIAKIAKEQQPLVEEYADYIKQELEKGVSLDNQLINKELYEKHGIAVNLDNIDFNCLSSYIYRNAKKLAISEATETVNSKNGDEKESQKEDLKVAEEKLLGLMAEQNTASLKKFGGFDGIKKLLSDFLPKLDYSNNNFKKWYSEIATKFYANKSKSATLDSVEVVEELKDSTQNPQSDKIFIRSTSTAEILNGAKEITTLEALTFYAIAIKNTQGWVVAKNMLIDVIESGQIVEAKEWTIDLISNHFENFIMLAVEDKATTEADKVNAENIQPETVEVIKESTSEDVVEKPVMKIEKVSKFIKTKNELKERCISLIKANKSNGFEDAFKIAREFHQFNTKKNPWSDERVKAWLVGIQSNKITGDTEQEIQEVLEAAA